MANAKRRTRDINAATRAALAIKLRAQRLTYEEIAQQCGYGSRGACHDAVMREMDRCLVENVEELRREEAFMLDLLHAEIWPLAMDKDNEKRLFAADRILAISAQRAKIVGLDKTAVAVSKVVVREAPAGYFGQPPQLEGAKP